MAREITQLRKQIKYRIIEVKEKIHVYERKLKYDSDKYIMLKKSQDELEDLQKKLDQLT